MASNITQGLFQQKDASATAKAFISSFVAEGFFVDMVRTCLFPAEFNTGFLSDKNTAIEFIKDFFVDLAKQCDQLNIPNTKLIKNNIRLTSTILNIRESGSAIIDYDNVFQHLTSLDLAQQKLIQKAIDSKLIEIKDFRQETEKIISNIQAFREVNSITSGINALDFFTEWASKPDISVFEAIKMWKETIVLNYNELSKLNTADKMAGENDYFVIGGKGSSRDLAKSFVQYLKTGYSFFKSGFDLFDRNIEGFESSSVHLISAPSNHGKSIFMINLINTLIRSNVADFEDGDVILFMTLEDNIYKVMRRYVSIFGNYKQDSVINFWKRSNEAFKAQQLYSEDNHLDVKVEDMFDSLFKASVNTATKERVEIVLKHAPENVFSAGDLSKFIDILKVDGYNVKAVVVDYVDTMAPTVVKKWSNSEYEVQGQIVQELRNLSRQYKLPVITATQNKRESENLQTALSNQSIGDSYKKVRYSDYIYMCRQDASKDVFSPDVAKYVFPHDMYTGPGQLSKDILLKKDQICSDLIPFEVKITKSKDAGKDARTYALFCKHNLRIYNNIREYLNDLSTLGKYTTALNKDVDALTSMAISSVSEDFDEFNDFSENDNSFDDSQSQLLPFQQQQQTP